MMNAGPGAGRVPRLRDRARYCMLAGTTLLIACIAGWVLAGGISVVRVLVAALVTAPLWLALTRLHRGDRRTYAWMTLALVPYLVVAVTELAANPQGRAWASGSLVLGFVVFATAVVYLRLTSTAASGTRPESQE